MIKNEGNLDRVIRVILGVVIIGVGSYYQSWLGFIGLIPLITGLIGYCPLYSIFGIKTCKK
ncbi:MAG: DUF2892 domain-containing protein [Candidatus Margulisbacteria bacterium]|nr:DUF2892 domain-containing protein [Candidatus Margulisiibacteriota bacterium]